MATLQSIHGDFAVVDLGRSDKMWGSVYLTQQGYVTKYKVIGLHHTAEEAGLTTIAIAHVVKILGKQSVVSMIHGVEYTI